MTTANKLLGKPNKGATATLMNQSQYSVSNSVPASFIKNDSHNFLVPWKSKAKDKILHGEAAIAAVEKIEGKLTPIQRHVVSLEGYSTDAYPDTKGKSTVGVGQTGPHKGKSFKEVFDIFEKQVRNTIPKYDSLPLYLQKELVQSAYRGDLGFSPDAVKLFNEGNFSDAAKEFLRNKDYNRELALEKKTGKKSGIAKRIKATSDAMDRYGRELEADDEAAGGVQRLGDIMGE